MKMGNTEWIFFGTVIGIAGAIVAAYYTYKAGEESAKETRTIIEVGNNTNEQVNNIKEENDLLKVKIDSLTSHSLEQLSTIQRLTMQNAELASKLGASNIQINGNLTGGDGFIELQIAKHISNVAAFVAVHHGKYPLYDIQSRIVDVEMFQQDLINSPSITQTQLLKSSRILEIGSLAPTLSKLMEPTDLLLDKNERTFNIFTTARNGSTTQTIKLKKVAGVYYSATRIYNTTTGKLLLENIEADYPDKQPNWK